MADIIMKPKCMNGTIQAAVTNRGHLIPCCYCDTINSYRDPKFKKLLAVSKVSEHESIEDIIMQDEWLEFEENLRMNTKLVEIPKGIVDKVRKKTNYFYKKKVHENKDKYDRETKTKSFLSRYDKSKSKDR